MASLAELIPVAAITSLIYFLSRRGLKALAETSGRALLKRLLKSVGTRIIPWLGIAYMIWIIIQAVRDCF